MVSKTENEFQTKERNFSAIKNGSHSKSFRRLAFTGKFLAGMKTYLRAAIRHFGEGFYTFSTSADEKHRSWKNCQ